MSAFSFAIGPTIVITKQEMVHAIIQTVTIFWQIAYSIAYSFRPFDFRPYLEDLTSVLSELLETNPWPFNLHKTSQSSEPNFNS